MSVLEMTSAQQPIESEFPRPLNHDEKELLVYLLHKFIANPATYLAQLEQLVVIRKCGCGCRTIDFWKAGEEPPPLANARVFWDGIGNAATGESVGLLLYEIDGFIASLDVSPFDDKRDCGFPLLDSIEEFPPLKPT